MKLSEYNILLTQISLVTEEVKKALTKKGEPFDSVHVLEFHNSFLVLRIRHNGKETLTYMNLWDIVDEKFCSGCNK